MKPLSLNQKLIRRIVRTSSSSSPTFERNSARRPSGDHAGPSIPSFLRRRRRASPPSVGITYRELPFSSLPMSLLEVNRIRFPSGETFGAESFPAVVSCLGSPPAVGTIHRFPSYSSLSSRARWTDRAANDPSGERLGSERNEYAARSSGSTGLAMLGRNQ